MSVTIADCLQLPAFYDAQLVAGKKGLDRYVSTVSVLEYGRTFAMDEQFFLGNELIITAFISIKDDVDAQCNAIKRLNELGEAGVVLYYVGHFVPCVDSKLIAVANRLGFPLIVMGPNKYKHRYSDVITEVLELILKKRAKEERFVHILLDQISKMNEHKRTIDGILRLLSDRIRCSFIIFDRIGREYGLATWPMVTKIDFIDRIRGLYDTATDFPIYFKWGGKKYYIHQYTFNIGFAQNMKLCIIIEAHLTNYTYFKQAIEVLEISCSIWGESLIKRGTDRIVNLILNNYDSDMYRIADEFYIDLEKIKMMWIIYFSNPTYTEYKPISDAEDEVRKYLTDNGKTVFIDVFDNKIVALLNESKYPDHDRELSSYLLKDIRETYPNTILIYCNGLDSAQMVRKAFLLAEEYSVTACTIYPNRAILTQAELIFSRDCYNLVHGGAAICEQYLSMLSPLLGQNDEYDILSTLAAYIIDTNMSTVETASILYIHNSTVKYRLDKIKHRLGYDITQMPNLYNLYMALAMWRIINKDPNRAFADNNIIKFMPE